MEKKIVRPETDLNFTRLAELLDVEVDLRTATSEDVLHAVLDIVGRHVAAGYRVSLTNFGSFTPQWRRVPEGGLPGKRAEGAVMPTEVRRVRFSATGLFADSVRALEPVTTLRKRGKGEVSGS